MEEKESDGFPMKITIGVCIIEEKAFSGPMLQILERLQAFGEFEIVHFGDKIILEDPVDRWPICDCLIVFHSSGYPLEKAEAYAALRKPFLANELGQQHLLHDRRKVYEMLQMFGIPVPRHAGIFRCSLTSFLQESHIHSLMNVLRYFNLDKSLQGESSLLCDSALEHLSKTKELDYMSYIVLRLY